VCSDEPCSGTVEVLGHFALAKSSTKKHSTKKSSTKTSSTTPPTKSSTASVRDRVKASEPFVILGSANYTIAAGSEKVITLKLTSDGKQWLASARTDSPYAEVKLEVKGGTASVVSIVVF